MSDLLASALRASPAELQSQLEYIVQQLESGTASAKPQLSAPPSVTSLVSVWSFIHTDRQSDSGDSGDEEEDDEVSTSFPNPPPPPQPHLHPSSTSPLHLTPPLCCRRILTWLREMRRRLLWGKICPVERLCSPESTLHPHLSNPHPHSSTPRPHSNTPYPQSSPS